MMSLWNFPAGDTSLPFFGISPRCSASYYIISIQPYFAAMPKCLPAYILNVWTAVPLTRTIHYTRGFWYASIKQTYSFLLLRLGSYSIVLRAEETWPCIRTGHFQHNSVTVQVYTPKPRCYITHHTKKQIINEFSSALWAAVLCRFAILFALSGYRAQLTYNRL